MFHCQSNSARADGNLAEAAGQLGKMMEHSNQSQPNPGAQADGTPCICVSPLSCFLLSLTMTLVSIPEAVYTMAFGGVATGSMNA